MTNLKTALEAYKPEVAASYSRIVSGMFARMLTQLGPDLKKVYNDWTWAKPWNETLSRVAARTEVKVEGSIRPVSHYSLDTIKLETAAQQYAEAVVESWEGKILAKMGELMEANVVGLDGLTFRITGKRNGADVEIVQQCIINFSKNGKPFNQFPARIRVNGKATSEAAYKKLSE